MRAGEAMRCAAALASALRSQWSMTAALRERQRRALIAQVHQAVRHVPFYRAAYAAQGIIADALQRLEDVARLPILRRAQIREQPDAFLSEQGDRRAWQESHTSGSMGRPLITWFDPDCWRQVKYALKARWLINAGFRPWHRVAVVDDVPAEELPAHATRLRVTGERWFGARRYLSVFEAPARHLEAYAAFRPHYIYCFPSYFAELANVWTEALRRRVPLRALITSGESMSPALRRRVGEVFGVPVLDVYGATEFKDIAWQCGNAAEYHVNMESVLVEIVDEEGRAVPDGTTGEIVVTSLTNRAMPLIRYATEDRAARLPGACACGRGLERLSAVEGRIVDYLRLPGGDVVSPYQLTTGLSTHRDVRHFKIVQRDAKTLEVAIVLRNDANGDTLDAVRDEIERCVKRQMAVRVRQVASIPRDASGKHRAVELAQSG